MNAYYSNLIEGHNTRPAEIVRAHWRVTLPPMSCDATFRKKPRHTCAYKPASTNSQPKDRFRTQRPAGLSGGFTPSSIRAHRRQR